MELRLCIIGFGNAARAFCRLLSEKRAETERDHGCRIAVAAVAGRSRGSGIYPGGIDPGVLAAAADAGVSLPAGREGSAGLDALSIIRASGANVLVELSTLSIADGQPAIRHIDTAFDCGMHVITANKGPVAWDFDRLNEKAERTGRHFLYETIVMDGTPVFDLVRETLPGCRVLGFRGILNSTTNFILAEMEQGRDFDGAVAEAQRRGFAEADPSLDIDGWDAAAKTAALANALLGAGIDPLKVEREGIAGVTEAMIRKARGRGMKYKLICEAAISPGGVRASVRPLEVPADDVFSHIDATSSILTLKTDLMGEISVIEKDPEIEQTAYGVFSDLLTLARRLGRSCH